MNKLITALFIGGDSERIANVRALLPNFEVTLATSPDSLFSILESPNDVKADLVYVVDGFQDIPLPEMAQLLRIRLPTQSIFFVTFDRENFDRQNLMKNGFSDAFLLPIDNEYMLKCVGRKGGPASDQAFSAVRLIDIEPDTKLDFEVAIFMPRNNKHISLIHQGDRLDRERLERLKSFRQNTIFVPANQMQSFYDYSARRLAELEDGARSSTESNEKLYESIRDFFTGILSASYSKTLNQGQQTTENIRKVVEKYIILKGGGSIYEQIIQEIGQSSDSYSHASRVSTFAALFSIALRASNTESVAIAGVLHDVGVNLLPAALQTKPEAAMTVEEQQVYKAHPLLTLETCKDRKLLLNDEVLEAIVQHHERFAGGGYPANLQGRRMRVSAQILALADRFDYLTRVEANLSPLEPEQALRRIYAEGIINPETLFEVQRIFKRQNAQKKSG